MATAQQKETAKQYFESNPSEGVVHISTDGQVFFQKNYNDGANHQSRIDNTQKLTSIFRKELEAAEAGSDDSVLPLPDDKWTKEKITEWLKGHKVETTGKETKVVLLELSAKALAEMSANGSAGKADDNESDENE